LLDLRHAAALHAECDVAAHRHRRVERVALEHHRDVAVLRRHAGHVASGDLHVSGRRRFQPGDSVQQRRLSASRRADQNDELTLVDREVDALQHVDAPQPDVKVVDLECACHRKAPSERRRW
jgi:hypothetical protein